MDPDALSEILQINPEVLYLPDFLETVLSKLSFSQFLLYLIHKPEIYQNIRSNQDFWYRYAQKHLPEYATTIPYNGNWFDFVVKHQFETYFSVLPEIPIFSEKRENYLDLLQNSLNTLRSSNQPISLPNNLIIKDRNLIKITDNKEEILLSNITKFVPYDIATKYMQFSIPHVLGLFLVSGKIFYLLTLYVPESPRQVHIAEEEYLINIVDICVDQRIGIFCINRNNEIIDLYPYVQDKIISLDRFQRNNLISRGSFHDIKLENVSNIKQILALEIITDKRETYEIREDLFLLLNEEGQLLVYFMRRYFNNTTQAELFSVTETKLNPENNVNLLIFAKTINQLIGPISKIDITHYFIGAVIIIKLWDNNDNLYLLNFSEFIEDHHHTYVSHKIIPQTEVLNELYTYFDNTNPDIKEGSIRYNLVRLNVKENLFIKQIDVLREFLIVALDDNGNVYLNSLDGLNVDVNPIGSLLDNSHEIQLFNDEVYDFDMMETDNNSGIIKWKVKKPILVPRIEFLRLKEAKQLSFVEVTDEYVYFKLKNSSLKYQTLAR